MSLDDLHRSIHSALQELREYGHTLFVEASSAGDVLSDVGRYALTRVRDRYQGRALDPVTLGMTQLIIEAGEQLIEMKKATAVAIADEKRLAKQAEQEADNAKEWKRRALSAAQSGDHRLAQEALALEQEHLAAASEYRESWEEQRAAVEELKAMLRRYNLALEKAKRAKNRLLARQVVVRARSLEGHAARMNDIVKRLELLAAFEQVMKQAGQDGEGNSVH